MAIKEGKGDCKEEKEEAKRIQGRVRRTMKSSGM